MGLDVVEYAKYGAQVTAVDLSPRSVDLARRFVSSLRRRAAFAAADAEHLPFKDNSFDFIIARGLLMYTPDSHRAVGEIYRVLKPEGEVQAILHNRYSWFAALALISGTNLYGQAEDPPINRLSSLREAKRLFSSFSYLSTAMDKYPQRTDKRSGMFAGLFNRLFVPCASVIPRSLMRPFGWYIIIRAIK
jgi:ubiquinone/menaquinone biosynthesis C-methylase UbiE